MSELVPLIDRDMYTRFEAARSEIEVAGTGHVSRVFVPVGVAPTSAPSTFPRVLFVGKATRDWGDEPFASFDGSKGGAEDVIRYWLPTGRRSAFWQFARQILCQTLQQCEIPFSENG